MNKIPSTLLPCLFIPENGVPLVIVKADKNSAFYFDSQKQAFER